MTSNTMVPADSASNAESNDRKPERLYYLDWLRVLLILGVFAFHAVHPFDALIPWYIKNEEQSGAVMAFLLLLNPWGTPLFFLVAGGVMGLVAYGGLSAVFGDQAFEWALTFAVPESIILIFVSVLMSWGWALNVLYLAMAYLNFSNKWLVYGSNTIMPFYLLHQPVIIVMAYFVVQWDISAMLGTGAGILLKLLVIVIRSFLITLGLTELLIRPLKPVRMLFGMKPRPYAWNPAPNVVQ